MSERRMILASQLGVQSNEKPVNVITVRPYIEGRKYLLADCSAQYPVRSMVVIQVSTNGMQGSGEIVIVEMEQEGDSGMEIDWYPQSTEITVTSIEPQEDDYYVYEVVVEY